MLKLQDIPVVVETSAGRSDAETSGHATVLALLSEVEAKLARLSESGEPANIDLKWLIHAPKMIQHLDDALGNGEVLAEISCNGNSRVHETAIPCVWRVSHRDPDGRPLGEFIEITEIPQLLRADRLSIPKALSTLRATIASSAPLLTRPEAPTYAHTQEFCHEP